MLNCPFCAADINFTSPKSNVKECVCGKILQLKNGSLTHDKALERARESYLIQPGSKGKWQDKPFTVTGKFTVRKDDLVCNYWTIIFEDGQVCYLAEGYGIYSILRPTTVEPVMVSFKVPLLKLHASFDFRTGEPFYLTRKDTDLTVTVSGEALLPEASDVNILDFYSEQGNNITLINFSRDHLHYYDTWFVEFADLHLTELSPPPEVKTYSCQQCYKLMEVKAFPFTYSLSCIHCGTHHYITGNDIVAKTTQRNKTDIGSDIEIGSSGTVSGITYEVIGFSLKEENNRDAATWKEYTLYNREKGFAFLSEYNGHWIFVKEQGKGPVVGVFTNHSFVSSNKEYELYNEYTYDVINAAGEHPYNILKTKNTKVKEFICPPNVWYNDTSATEVNWFYGQHLPNNVVFENFHFPGIKPSKSGVGMVDPVGMMSKGRFALTVLIAALVLIGIHFLTGMSKQERPLLESNYMFDTTNSITVISDPFTLDKWKSNLRFDIDAGVDNSWFQLGASLISLSGGKHLSFEKGVEHYSGYSEGERWTEGSTSEVAYLTDVPPGKYYLRLTGTKEPNTYNSITSFYVRVRYDVNSSRNMWMALLMLAICGAIQYFIFNYYNRKRWENSNYSPYVED